MKIASHYRLLFRALRIVAALAVAKVIAHLLGWEALSINPLFSGILAANVFLMGFLLSGVLSDFKESEKLPGELAACLENIAQDAWAVGCLKPEAQTGPCLALLAHLNRDILAWFYQRGDASALMDRLNQLTPRIAELERWTPATMVTRMKMEQGNLRRTLTRVNTIRETSFVSAGYLLAYIITTLLCVALVLAKIEPFYESLFFLGVISYMVIFLLMLIRDLDNPFGYYERNAGAEVSLKPLEETSVRLAKLAGVEEFLAQAEEVR